ncbi:MAG: HEPN domain-containing protein [Nitrosotalea sp.]
MSVEKKYLKWCAKQKNGIKLIKESENLQKAYLNKSKIAVQSMKVNAKAGLDEWTISTSYYAKYFAVYALLSRIGIKCEIHTCTISLFSYLFSNDISPQLMQDLRQAKDDRVDAQYYTTAVTINSSKILADTKNFVIRVEEIIDRLNSQKISDIRNKIKSEL